MIGCGTPSQETKPETDRGAGGACGPRPAPRNRRHGTSLGQPDRIVS